MTEQKFIKLLQLYLTGVGVRTYPSLEQVKEGESSYFKIIADIIYESGRMHEKEKNKRSRRGSATPKLLGSLDPDLLKEEIYELLYGKPLGE